MTRPLTPGELTFLYVSGEQIGYARMGQKMADELERRGYRIFNDDSNPTASTTTWLQRHEGGRQYADPPTNLIAWASVPSHMAGWRTGQHRAFITMWEAMSLPEGFRELFHEIDTMIVPSEQNAELFGRYHPNVHVMPLGVDPKLWHYIPPTEPSKEFNFLIAGRGVRKGTDLTFKAFREVFRGVTDGPTPRLIMKSMKGHGEFYAMNVEHRTGRLDAVVERDLYASAHCYVQPSRGEGFGLQPLQALALGRPTILTDAHGHKSFSHLGIGLSTTPEPAAYFSAGDAGNWWLPDYDELCEAMWDVYKNYTSHAKQAAESARVIARDFTWSNTVDRFVDILGDELVRPFSGGAEWTEPVRQLYPIVTLRDFYTEIAGRSLAFEQGKEYWESADVKRLLFDGGVLDPVCCTEADDGLAPIQVAQLGHYRASHESCPRCGQPLNTAKTRADQIFEELEAEAAAR